MRKKNKLVQGVGINDADYVVRTRINGKRVMCHFYKVWQGMLRRCYDTKYQDNQPTYEGCIVCEEWLTFSNFKQWMETQDWKGKQLDKDLLVRSNKIYSPTTCVFVDRMTNNFIIDSGAARGEWPIGVTFIKQHEKFQAKCCNPFTKIEEHLGLFTCPNDAHSAWLGRKCELAHQLADLQIDKRVAAALRERYSSDKLRLSNETCINEYNSVRKVINGN